MPDEAEGCLSREDIPRLAGCGLLLSVAPLTGVCVWALASGWLWWAVLILAGVFYFGLVKFWGFQTLYWQWRYDCFELRLYRESMESPMSEEQDTEPKAEEPKVCSAIKVLPHQEAMVCVCYMCYPKARELGEVIPDCWLFENDGKWGLMCQPGHKDYELLMFPEKPWADPDPECEHDDDEIAALNDKWINVVCDWEDKVVMRPTDGHFLVKSCEEAGWWKKDESGEYHGHKLLLQWLFDHCGRKLVELECEHARRFGGDQSAGEPAPETEGDVVDGGPAGSAGVPPVGSAV